MNDYGGIAMRLINVTEYNHNRMVLARPVLDSKRRVLLAAGRTIDPKIKDRLINMGIKFLFVEDEVSKGISMDDMLDMPTWTDSIQVVKDFYDQVKAHKQDKKKPRPEIRNIQQIAKKLTDEVKVRPLLVLIPSGTIATELQPYAHAVNVTILSLLTAKKLGYGETKLKDLAIGALLHDIGKALTDNYEEHSEVGFNYLRDVSQMSIVSAHVAYQHHEKVDGSGFPRMIKGESVLEFGQICGVANMYENFINIDHLPPHEAMEGVMAASDRYYAYAVVRAFSHSVPTYPPGTKVVVQNHDAIVTRIHKHLQRPFVRIIEKNKELDLSDHPTLMIKPE